MYEISASIWFYYEEITILLYILWAVHRDSYM